MTKRRFTALALVLCVLAGSIPVTHAAGDRQNVLKGAHYESQFNLNEDYYSDSVYGGKSDPSKLVDDRYGAGPTNKDNGLNTKVLDQYLRYDADGKLSEDGEYLWGVTFRLGRACDVDGFTLITDDMSNLNIGVSSTVPWLQMGFDILVSETGEDGSWQVVHSASALHTATDKGQYTYVSSRAGYYVYSASFTAVSAKYVRFAATSLTCPDFDKAHWINITEIQLFGYGDVQDTVGNVMLGAECIRTVNVNTDKYSDSVYGGKSDPSKMTDGLYGVGPANKDEGFNTKAIDKWRYYDADGKECDNGEYLWSVTFKLDGEYTVDSLSLITMDLTPFIGDTNPEQWLQMGFDILVSETGEPGSWVVAHRALDLHTESDPGAYMYVAPTDAHPMGYYEYTASFTPVKAKYIQYGCTDYTSYTIDQGHWINISELEVYCEEIEDVTVASGTCGENLTWELSAQGALTVTGTGDMYDFSVGGAPWKDYKGNIRTLTVGEGVTSIGDNAFSLVRGLRAVSLPDGLTRIGASAFEGCSALTAVYLPDTVAEIGSSAFESCVSLRQINIPQNVKVIREETFCYCQSMKQITIPEGVTDILSGAFAQCYGLTSVHIPKSVANIEEKAFNDCRGITAFTTDGESTAYMADGAGALLTKDGKTLLQFPIANPVDTYTVASTVTYIGEEAFGECRIGSLTLPASVEKIGKNAFILATVGRLVVLNDSVELKPTNISTDTVICGYAGSTAEEYASYYRHPFEALPAGGVCGEILVANPTLPVSVRLVQGETDVAAVVITPSAKTILFSFSGIAAGTYDLIITGEGFLPYTVSGIVVEDAVVDLTAHPNESISRITVQAGDINGDGRIDLQDVVILTSEKTYGRSYEEVVNQSADVNGDKIFDLQDLAIITSQKGYSQSPICVSYGD